MRPGPNIKRQRGRNNNGRNKPHLPPRSQTYDSNGPDVRIRGNAYQVLEKYLALARDAQAAGDRVAAENFYQHAEHYYRLINSTNSFDRQQMPPGDGRQGLGQEEFAPPAMADPGSGPQPSFTGGFGGPANGSAPGNGGAPGGGDGPVGPEGSQPH